jgi:AraC family transcriptional regulator, arabinose operon regulatory protein
MRDPTVLLDDSPISASLVAMLIPDGFPGQRLRVLPQPLIKAALKDPLTGRLLVTDAGHFPHATSHGRSRPDGAGQAILILCTEGGGWLTMHGTHHTISAGEAVLIPPGTPHRYGADQRDPWTIWWLHAEGVDVPTLVDAVLGADRQPVIPVRDMFGAVALAQQVVSEVERDETRASLYAAVGPAWNLFAQLAADRLRGRAGSVDRIHLVQDHLRAHLAEPTSVPALARLAGMSTSHFAALFKASAGTGVVEYVKRLRIARARELLITTDALVAEIASAIGYTDAFYFSRQFRSVNGMSPTEYRSRSRRELI